MARHNNFHTFRPAKTRGTKEEELSSRQNRLQGVPAEVPTTYNGRSTVGEFPDRTDQQHSGDVLLSSVRSINKLTQST